MKTTIYLSLLLLLTFVFITVSCNKNVDNIPPETIDSVKAILPKQVILVNGTTDTLVTTSFKYDTLNHKVELYEDNRATPNLFDKLVITFSFNNDGYLIGYLINTDIFGNTSFDNALITINRASDNKIKYIAYYDREKGEKDTTFFTYELINGNTKIAVKGDWAYLEGNTDYTYDANNKLLSYQFAGGGSEIARFNYNPNNSLSKVVKTGGDFDNVIDFSYASGLPDDKENMLERILLGKDYYLWDLKVLSPFTFYLDADYDDFPISFTDPYHFTRMQDTHKPNAAPTGIEGFNMIYNVNQDKLLSKITIIPDDKTFDGGMVLFRY